VLLWWVFAGSPEDGQNAEDAERDPPARTASAGAGRLQGDSTFRPAHARSPQAWGSESSLHPVARREPRLSAPDVGSVGDADGHGWAPGTRKRYRSPGPAVDSSSECLDYSVKLLQHVLIYFILCTGGPKRTTDRERTTARSVPDPPARAGVCPR
jgi:hypothetical protein